MCDVEEAADDLVESGIEIDEVVVGSRGEEGGELIGIILEERALAVGGAQGVPVVVAPVAVLADAYVAHGHMARRGLHRDDQVLRAVGHGDGTAVADGLLDIVLGGVDEHLTARKEGGVVLLVPRDGSEISGSQGFMV